MLERTPAAYTKCLVGMMGNAWVDQALPAALKVPHFPYCNIDLSVFEHLKVKSQLHLEVGSYVGNSAVKTVKHLQQYCAPLIICVDTWLGDAGLWANAETCGLVFRHGEPFIFDFFKANIVQNKMTETVLPVRLASLSALRLFKKLGMTFDSIYIDSSHFYEDTLLEITECISLLEPGGLLFGDDWAFEGVKRAVTEAAERHHKSIGIMNDLQWLYLP